MGHNTVFRWAWNDRPAWLDSGMTRTRAARLLRAWRNTSRRANSHGNVMRTLQRVGPGIYRITDNASDETGTMFIERSKGTK